MEPSVANLFDYKAYGPLYVLLIGLALGTWWIIKWIFANQKELQEQNAEREKRYITVMEAQAIALQSVDNIKQDIKEIKYWMQNEGGLKNEKRY